MPQEKTLQNCRLCKSSKIHFVLERDDVLIFKCLDCGVVFLGNQLDEESVKDLYKYYSSTGFSNYLSPVTKLRYEKLLDGFEKYRKNNALMDVGCGAGYFMLSASKKGWRVEGTEISDEAIKLAEEKGQRVYKGDISSLNLREKSYDIAVLMQLLEHASDPEGIIKKLSIVLRPGGMIYITTPNYNSLSRGVLRERWGMFSKEHMFYFTRKTLGKLLKKCGFRIKRARAENISLIELSKIFKKGASADFAESYKKQEQVRELTEKKLFFSIAKRMVNFILNIFGIGETLYILAEKCNVIPAKAGIQKGWYKLVT